MLSKTKKTWVTILACLIVIYITSIIGDSLFGFTLDDKGLKKMDDKTAMLSVVGTVITIFAIHFTVKFDSSNDDKIIEDKKRNKIYRQRMEEHKKANAPISSASLVYYGGGKVTSQRRVDVAVYKNRLEYAGNIINVENIESASIRTESQVTTHVKSRLTATRMFTFGVFALAAPKHKVTNQTHSSTYLSIDYNENGRPFSLVFEGNGATGIEFAINQILRNYDISLIKEWYMSKDNIEIELK